MKKGKKVISFALALALSIGAVATGITPSASAKAGGVKTYKPTIVNHAPTKKVDPNAYVSVPLGSNPPSLDSSSTTDAVSFEVLATSMEGLTRQEWDEKGRGVSGPGAAEKWEVTPNGLKWTFYIRKMQWSDGKPVTAKDFEYAWLRLLDPNQAAEYASFLYFIKGAEEYNKKQGSVKNVGIRALSASKLEVTLKRPTPFFEKMLSFGILLPIRKDIATKLGDKYGTVSGIKQMVWCGPFKIDSWQLSQKLVVKKNPTYWDAKRVNLSEVRFSLSDMETATRIQMFQNHQFDYTGATKNYIAQLADQAKAGKFQYDKDTTMTTWYINFNNQDKKGVFTNEKIRKAFGLAVNREQMCKVVYKRNIPFYAFVPAKLASGVGSTDFRTFAKTEPFKDLYKKYPTKNEWQKLLIEGLKEAKLNPDPSKLEVNYVDYGATSDDRARYEFLQSQWETNLGVKVKITVLADFGQFLKEEKAGNFQIAMNGWGPDYNDPLTFLDLFETGNGNMYAKYSNKDSDKLIAQIKAEVNATKRASLMVQLEKKVLTEAAVAPLFVRDVHRFKQNYLYGLGCFDIGADYDYKYAYTSGRK